MAAILIPTALSTPTDPAGAVIGRAIDAKTAVAPWNRADTRQQLRPVRHLRLVTDPAPATIPVTSPRRPIRILVAGLGLAALVAFAAIGVLPFLGADAAAVSPASSADTSGPTVADVPPASAPVEASVATRSATPSEIIVQSGDSLWTIARRLQPRGDLRHLVDRLIERVGGTSVTRGQHIDVRGLLD